MGAFPTCHHNHGGWAIFFGCSDRVAGVDARVFPPEEAHGDGQVALGTGEINSACEGLVYCGVFPIFKVNHILILGPGLLQEDPLQVLTCRAGDVDGIPLRGKLDLCEGPATVTTGLAERSSPFPHSTRGFKHSNTSHRLHVHTCPRTLKHLTQYIHTHAHTCASHFAVHRGLVRSSAPFL